MCYKSISDDEVADWPTEITKRVRKLIPKKAMERRSMRYLVQRLEELSKQRFKWALKKAVVDYILMDPTERVRIRIYQVPQTFPLHVIRGPIPWHANYVVSKDVVSSTLFMTHPVSVAIRKLWDEK